MESHQDTIWNRVWARGGFSTAIVDVGRGVYNWFFRRVLRRYLASDILMLELGCGTSSLTISLAREVKKIIGLDISHEALELSKKNMELAGVHNMEFVHGDCLDVPYEGEFHFLWSQGLLEHFDDPLAVARQHFKAIRPGGTALMSVPYYYSYHNLWYIFTRPRFLRSLWLWPGVEQTFFTRKQLQEIGAHITPHARVFFLQPLLLGIVFLELKK